MQSLPTALHQSDEQHPHRHLDRRMMMDDGSSDWQQRALIWAGFAVPLSNGA